MLGNPGERFLTLTNNLFTFHSYTCDCVTDIENIKPGVVKKTIKIQGLPNQDIRFAFAPGRGIVRLAESGAINSDCILTELISLPEHDTEKLFTFFREYGFLFPVSTTEYEAIDIDDLFNLISRIRATVQLMSELGEIHKDYESILAKVLFLQLDPPVELWFQCFGEHRYRTYVHQLYSEIENASRIPPIDGTREAFDNDTYDVEDTIYEPIFQLNIETYNDTVGGYNNVLPGANQSLQFRDVVRLYRNAHPRDPELRKTIDFLFHYQTNIGVIKSYHSNGKLEYYNDSDNIETNKEMHFDERLQHALIDIAKTTIRDELGYDLYGIQPYYDTETMSPTWKIQDLLTGLYFSIFYMKPDVELYRKCANPNCDRWFLVKTTSTKRKYCTPHCRNAVAQRAHRKRRQAQNAN